MVLYAFDGWCDHGSKADDFGLGVVKWLDGVWAKDEDVFAVFEQVVEVEELFELVVF